MIKTKKDFIKFFKEVYIPGIRDEEREYCKGNEIDWDWRHQIFSDVVRKMVYNKELPERDLDWTNPYKIK